jgi:site-specific recombinase XerD
LLWALDTPFSKVNEKNPSFISYLHQKTSPKTGEGLSRETWRKILGLSTRFYKWAKSTYSKEYESIPQTWIDSLKIPKNIIQTKDTEYVTFEEIQTISNLKIPKTNLALLRDQAAAVLLFLSGMRAGAFVTMPIKAVDLKERSIKQWQKLGVQTKNNKSQTTYIYPIADLLEIVDQWDQVVRKKLPV